MNIKISTFFKLLTVSLCLLPMMGIAEAKQPNILWIVAEDLSPWMGCYGDEVNKDHTPNIDAMAE